MTMVTQGRTKGHGPQVAASGSVTDGPRRPDVPQPRRKRTQAQPVVPPAAPAEPTPAPARPFAGRTVFGRGEPPHVQPVRVWLLEETAGQLAGSELEFSPEERLHLMALRVEMLSQQVEELQQRAHKNSFLQWHYDDAVEKLSLADPFIQCGAVYEGGR